MQKESAVGLVIDPRFEQHDTGPGHPAAVEGQGQGDAGQGEVPGAPLTYLAVGAVRAGGRRREQDVGEDLSPAQDVLRAKLVLREHEEPFQR